MKILHRYILKEHLGPFLFALFALTSFLLLNYLAKKFGELVGKGLPWDAIGEFIGLSVPFTVALSFPMAVLIATLYAFSRLAAENEITALKASGVSLRRIMLPVIVAAIGATLFMVVFNDQILPATNHRLSNLIRDIGQKKPTFALREQIINEVSPGKLYLRAGHLDEGSNRMREITIYDLGDPSRRRTIYADSGNMVMSKDQRDLIMTLYSGMMQDVPTARPAELERLYFVNNRIRVRDVGNEFQQSGSQSEKSDREMTICEMQHASDSARISMVRARRDYEQKTALARAKGIALESPNFRPPKVIQVPASLGGLYCQLVTAIQVRTAGAQTPTSRPSAGVQTPTPGAAGAAGAPPATPLSTGAPPVPGAGPALVSPQSQLNPSVIENARSELMQSWITMNRFDVEIHKKFAMSVACLVFVLLGAPIALRFPRGGVGLTIGVSLFVFALYYVGLIAGGSAADHGYLPAWAAMWATNVIFFIVALGLMARMGRESSTSRGGDLRELFDVFRSWVAKRLRPVGIPMDRRRVTR